MSEAIKTIKKTEPKTVRKCCVCEGATESMDQPMCDDCRRTVLVVRTVITLMRKEGLCFLSGLGDVEKEVKTINV